MHARILRQTVLLTVIASAMAEIYSGNYDWLDLPNERVQSKQMRLSVSQTADGYLVKAAVTFRADSLGKNYATEKRYGYEGILQRDEKRGVLTGIMKGPMDRDGNWRVSLRANSKRAYGFAEQTGGRKTMASFNLTLESNPPEEKAQAEDQTP